MDTRSIYANNGMSLRISREGLKSWNYLLLPLRASEFLSKCGHLESNTERRSARV